jgi:hypothetical protein
MRPVPARRRGRRRQGSRDQAARALVSGASFAASPPADTLLDRPHPGECLLFGDRPLRAPTSEEGDRPAGRGAAPPGRTPGRSPRRRSRRGGAATRRGGGSACHRGLQGLRRMSVHRPVVGRGVATSSRRGAPPLDAGLPTVAAHPLIRRARLRRARESALAAMRLVWSRSLTCMVRLGLAGGSLAPGRSRWLRQTTRSWGLSRTGVLGPRHGGRVGRGSVGGAIRLT